ncbi:MAG TPA: NTP transferase domain-containing protein [Microthrixaceae bacterium]|nr:NTP transferase domain-containing protein [Microthrixaceae bacterium]
MSDSRPLSAVILAAGQGSRMKSERPKPLHRLCGRPMLMYVLDSLRSCRPESAVIVIGHKGDWVIKKIGEEEVEIRLEFVEQRVQRGTGDAALIGVVGLPEDGEEEGDVVVLPGDAPLLRPETIARLVDHHRSTEADVTVLTARLADPTGYGRIIRGKEGRVERVVEHSEATPDELTIDEVNTSIYCFRRSLLAPALRRLAPDNTQGEYFLTDVVAVLSQAGYAVGSVDAPAAIEIGGVNDRLQLAGAERELRRRTNERLLRSGVTMLDPDNTFVDTTVAVGQDVTLFPGTILQGDTSIGDGTEVGPSTRLVDCTVGAGAVVESTTARRAKIGDGAHVGPYAVLEPGADVPGDHRTGPFYNSSAD